MTATQSICSKCRMPLRPGETCQLHGGLSVSDVKRLQMWAWRYSLHGQGFSDLSVSWLIFMRWLRERGRLSEVVR